MYIYMYMYTRARSLARVRAYVYVRRKPEGYNITANYAPLATLIGFRGEGRAGGIPLMAYHLDLHNCSRPRDRSKWDQRIASGVRREDELNILAEYGNPLIVSVLIFHHIMQL